MEILLNHICYELYADGTATVSQPKEQIQGYVNIPSAFTYQEQRYRVTRIGFSAFSNNCKWLTAITIPDSVTSIEGYAFYGCTGLTSITIPNSVTSIGRDAFHDCTGLTSITIPNSVTSIGEWAFRGCTGLTSITIPNSVTSIEGYAFSGCTGLTSITIPNSVTSIGSLAFFGCIGLTAITIPNSVTSIEHAAFEGCTGLTAITIPNSVTSIEGSAFYGCTGLTSITIPNSVTSIEECAFFGCTGLSSITIPDSVTSIGGWAFDDCTGLTAITIPNSVTSIGDGAFYGCTGLTSITMPNSVTSIGGRAFENCTGLTSITIPNSVTSIGEWAFRGCTGLTSISLPKTLTDIGDWVFIGCENLQIIRVPKGKKEDYCKLGLEPYRELIQEPQEEEYTILLNIARGYEMGIGMAKNLAQAVLCYVQAADKGCNEAAFHLGELYETGNGLPPDLRQAAEWYAKATALYHPSAENKRRACLQKLEQEEKRMEAYQHEQAQERVNRVAERAKAKYLFFDTETNGLPYNYKAGIENTSNWPRLLQIGWIMTDERGNVLKSCTKWIFPNGFSVDSEVTKLTGITTDKLLFEGERISSVLNDFLQDIENAEVLVGHNVEYDIMVVGCELYRDGQPMQGQALTRHPHICTMKQTVDFCAIPSTNSYYSDYKYPKLTELYTKLFGHAFSGAHDAMADIKATKECFFELKRRGIL